MKKKFFKVKDKWKIVDLIVALLVITITTVSLIGPVKELLVVLKSNEITFIAFILVLLFMVVITMAQSIPSLIIYIIIRVTVNKNKRKNATFEVINNIDYYRNDFGEISPALISLMVNLDIEDQKDITAMLLYYQLNDLVKFSNGKVEVNKNKLSKESDKRFFEWFEGRSELSLTEWKNTVKQEGIEQGYIKQEKKGLKGCLVPIICFVVEILLFTLSCVILSSSIANEIFEFGLGVTLIILFVLIINSFWLFMAYFITKTISKKNIKRTKTGHELTEKIYAMKNFIHDFSNLSQATKESLCMWEYFLIYAVVLEENEKIIDEIKEYYSPDFTKLLSSEVNTVDKKCNT